MKPRDVIDFWLAQPAEAYFVADTEFDDRLREKFGAAHAQAVSGGLDSWQETRDGRLALILLLDQMSRNLRGAVELLRTRRCKGHCDCRVAQRTSLHGAGDRARIQHVVAEVGAVVDA